MFLNNFNINGVEVNLNDTIRDLNDIVQTLTRSYFKLAIPTFAEFLRPILGDEITIEMGKTAGNLLNIFNNLDSSFVLSFLLLLLISVIWKISL